MKLVIVGGVAGGASAAARARRLSETADILLLERGPDVSFANCGLPYHIGEVIPQREKLLVTTPERLRERFRIDVRTRSEVEAIDRESKTIRIRNLESGVSFKETYDKLILAPGASPIRPPFPGADLPNVSVLRNLEDMDRIKKLVDGSIKHAVVVGAGFIGIELAENLLHRGIGVTILDLGPQILAPFDPEMTTPILSAMKARGAEVLLRDSVESVNPAANGVSVRLRSGSIREAGLVILGIGVRPENKLALEAGLEIGPRGGIRVNELLETSDPDIYAVGDAVETSEFGSGERVQVPLAGPANRQGRIAADNVFGRKTRYRGTQSTAILGFFEHTAAMTGMSEKLLKQRHRPYQKVYIHPSDHAGYYPGASPMSLKLLFDPESGKLLGAQGVGKAGVDKRIDVLALAIQSGMTVFDLEEVELCYSPQFGSAKDPVNMLGFVASGLLRADHPQIAWEELAASKTELTLLDVRTKKEFEEGHIEGATNIPVDMLRGHATNLPHDRAIVVYCQVGQRGYLATRILLQAGFKVRNLAGGYKTYLMYQ